MSQKFVVCPCQGLSEAALPQEDLAEIAPSMLCGADENAAAAALAQEEAILCCSQDAAVFEGLANALDRPVPPILDLRDRLGSNAATPPSKAKTAALLAEAILPSEGTKTIDVVSEGVCLILGRAEVVALAADQLKDYLSVTCLIPPGDEIDDPRRFDVVKGDLRRASGALGQFEVTIDGLQQRVAGVWNAPRDGGVSACDIILDLRGGTPLFPAHDKREGYLRVDPDHPPSIAAAILTASHLVGTFEKPLYVRVEPQLCAHSRAEQTGCTRCLDLCPTSAIQPSGDHVAVDPMICAGCGACSSACPSGAISYDAPAVEETMRRVQTLAQVTMANGAERPRLFVYDSHGAEMLRLATRANYTFPDDVLPMEMAAINAFGHAEMLAAAAAGFAEVALLPGPGADAMALEAQIEIAQALSGTVGIRLLDVSDPERLSEAFEGAVTTPGHTPVRPMGTRRQIARQAARALNGGADRLPLPKGAPYGELEVDTDACTLCLSCVSLCPSGALGDNPDKPQLRFQEDACLQCGICVQVCPEDALSLAPGLDLSDAALKQRVLHEEEPFPCVSCGTLFGSKSAIDRITEKLTGHAMFADPERLRMIQMCDDCRVQAQVHSTDNPFQTRARPKPRTTDDYLSTRKDH